MIIYIYKLQLLTIISDFKPIIFSFVCSNLTNYIPSYLSFLALKGKKKLEKVKNKSRSGRPDCRSNITDVDKSKKRPAQPSKFDLPNKRSKKEESQVPYGKNAVVVGRQRKIVVT